MSTKQQVFSWYHKTLSTGRDIRLSPFDRVDLRRPMTRFAKASNAGWGEEAAVANNRLEMLYDVQTSDCSNNSEANPDDEEKFCAWNGWSGEALATANAAASTAAAAADGVAAAEKIVGCFFVRRAGQWLRSLQAPTSDLLRRMLLVWVDLCLWVSVGGWVYVCVYVRAHGVVNAIYRNTPPV